MAKKTAEPKVTRIKAADSPRTSSAKAVPKKETSTVSKKQIEAKKADKKQSSNPLRAIGGYFKGSWQELRQVRWPNRRTTWGLTLAVLLFTAFFVALVVLLDLLFQWIFDNVVLG